MRKTFLLWLLLVVMLAFGIAFATSFMLETKNAEQSTLALIQLKLDDLQKQLTVNDDNLRKIRDESDADAIVKARAFAYMLTLSPEIATDYKKLVSTAKTLGVDELDIVDGKGIISASTEKRYVGFDMSKSPQAGAFMPLLKDKSLGIVQDPMPIGYDASKVMQYAGVARKDADGFVQIAYRPERLEEAMRVADIKNLAPSFRIGTNGEALVAKKGIILSINQPAWVDKPLADYGIYPYSLVADTGDFWLDRNSNTQENLCAYKKMDDYIIVGCVPRAEVYLSRNVASVQLVVINFIIFAIIFFLVSLLVQKVVINGIYKINGELAKITGGNLNVRVNVKTNKEFSLLSSGINTMVGALKRAIKEAAARIDKELEFAKQIQHSAMPSVFPPFPERKEFEIFASMHTAKEVGGDFYDFFFIDDKHLAVVIADVSGKGIPAALFMMTAKTLIKNYANSGLSPAKVFTAANNRLAENNEQGMFVTAFMGVLNTATGELTYVNAGHNPPALLDKKAGKFAFLDMPAGFVLGGMGDLNYTQHAIKLAKGEVIYLYTDGVTEALNTAKQLFSGARLLRTLDALKSTSLEKILGAVKAAVDKFAGKEPQADDITMLALKYNGGKAKKSLK